MRQKCQKSGSADQKDGFGTALLAHALETVADLGLLRRTEGVIGCATWAFSGVLAISWG
jgi:hypothetical protein